MSFLNFAKYGCDWSDSRAVGSVAWETEQHTDNLEIG